MDSRRKTVAKKKKPTNDDTEEENILQESLHLIEFLYKFRLIEKIARPIDKRVREEKITEYGERLGDLHDKLMKIKNEICLLYTSPSPRDQRGSRMPSSA